MKGDCSGNAGAKMRMKAPAKCEVNLTCFPAAVFFRCVLTKTVIHSALHYAELDLNPSLGINLFLCTARSSPQPGVGKVEYLSSIYTYLLSTYCALRAKDSAKYNLAPVLKETLYFSLYVRNKHSLKLNLQFCN